jgi:hypothetical protein
MPPSAKPAGSRVPQSRRLASTMPDDVDVEVPPDDELQPQEGLAPGEDEGAYDYDEGDEEELASIVPIERWDDVASVCGRIDTAPTFAVILHARRGNRSLSSELGMRRLRRHAEDAGKVVAIATRSSSLASRARQVGIPVASTPDLVRWHSGGRVVLGFGRRAVVVPAFARHLHVLLLGVAVAVLVAIILTLGPSATVIAYPEADELSATVEVTASLTRAGIDIETLQVPLRQVSATRTFTLVTAATGKARVPRAAAATTLAITNPTNAPVSVPGGAVVVGGPDIIGFRIAQGFTVAPGATVRDVHADALHAGAEYNLPAGAINGWLDESLRALTVTNPTAALGGISEEVPAIAPNDINVIREQQRLIRDPRYVRRIIIEGRPHDAVFLDTIRIDAAEVVPPLAPGTPAELLIVEYRVTVTGDAIVQETLEAIARRVLREQAGAGVFIEGSVTAEELGPARVDPQTESVTTRLEVRGKFARGLTEEDVRSTVKGRSPSDAEAALKERYGMQEATVQLSPGWAPWVPRFGFRIEVDFREAATDTSGRGAAVP